MSGRPVLEDVVDDDIDNMDMDIAQFDPSLTTPIAPLRQGPTVTRSQDLEPPLFPQFPVQNAPLAGPRAAENVINPNLLTPEQRAKFRAFQVVYPCYFDRNRSHSQGRRVSLELAVENPLAKTVSDACEALGLSFVLELDKTHPQDYGNPGRIRIMLKTDGVPVQQRFATKRSLFNSIAQYLQKHPTTLRSIEKTRGIPYPPDFETGFVPELLPKVKGFKMNTIAPVHSRLTMKHPMTKSIYDAVPDQPQVAAPQAPKQPKKKVMKIRG